MRLGAHMSVDGGKHMAILRGKEIGCESIQVFVRNVRSWTSKPLEKKEIDVFLKKKEELKNEIWPIMSHNSYLVNLAGIEKEKLEKSYNAMLDELIKADQLQIDYLNIHPGNKQEDEEEEVALERIAKQINKLFEETKDSKVKLLLETTAGQGKDLGFDFNHMKFIIDKVKNKDRIGVTFDTCHTFAAGYDFATKTKYDEMWDEFDNIIGLNFLYAFHINDSEKGLGSRVDRHTHIGQGEIGKEPFGFFLNDERFHNHPGILETPKEKDMKEDTMNLKTLRSLIQR